MGQLKPWQMVLIVVAVVVLGASIAWQVFGRERVDKADSVLLMDVATGDLYRVDVRGSRGVAIPARHPDNGERTLIPVIRDDDGVWTITERYRSAVERMEVEPTDRIDRSTWVVGGDFSDIATYRKPS